jgi:putative Ca2+/H+ antiporter (TMEM165/GDT1 family)
VEPFLVSTLVVGLAEIGDKTQILSLMLAARFQQPVPILFGILVATLANHAAAGLTGTLSGSLLDGAWMRRILGLSFLSVALVSPLTRSARHQNYRSLISWLVGSPAIFHSGNPSSSRRARYPRSRSNATASYERTHHGPRQ